MIQFEMVKKVSDSLPKFNKDFILNYRYRVFNDIIHRIENSFIEAFAYLLASADVEYEYLGYKILTPEEKIEAMLDPSITASLSPAYKSKKKTLFEVHLNTLVLVQYNFRFGNSPVSMYVHVPFLRHHKASYGGVNYYPDLPIVEKCLHINKKENLLTIKVTRTPLKFWRIAPPPIFDAEKKHTILRDALITAKITKANKNNKGVPIVIYHLVEGFYNALHRYGFRQDELLLSEIYDPADTAYKYYDLELHAGDIKLDRTIYVKVSNKIDKDINKRRFVVGLITLLRGFKRPFTIKDMIDPEATLWLLILGLHTYQNDKLIEDDTVVIRFAKEVLMSNKTMLDSLTARAFKSIGIEISDFSDFLFKIFIMFDKWYSEYKASDLYDKRISYTSMYANFEKPLNLKVYSILKSLKQKKRVIESLFNGLKYAAGYQPTWLFDNTGLFQSNPQLFNSYLSILFRRFISADSDESGGKVGKRIQTEFLLAHPSQLAVTSINTVPASSPIVSGSINPYIDVDDLGNIIVDPEIKEYVKKCFHNIDEY